MNRFLLWLYKKLHKKFHEESMEWYNVKIGAGEFITEFKLLGPPDMKVTSLKFVPGKTPTFYNIQKVED